MFAMLNGWEIVAIMVLALVFFGAKKLPELARGLGQGIREFKKASHEVQNEIENAASTPEKTVVPADKQDATAQSSSSPDKKA